MRVLLKRNLKLYFRNRSGVAFSFLAVAIVLLVCVVFLENSFVNSVLSSAPQIDRSDAQWLVRCWVLAGLLSVTPVTTSAGAFGSMIRDRETKIIKDFKSSPLNRTDYPLAMVISAWIIGCIMTLVLYAAFFVYILLSTGKGFSTVQFLRSFAIIALTSLTGCCLNGWLLSYCKTSAGYTNYATLLGTNIGFFNAIYIPMGGMPSFLRSILKIFPFGGAAAMQRNVLLEGPIAKIFEGAPASVVSDFREYFGVDYVLGSFHLTPAVLTGYLMIIALFAFLMFMFNYNARQEEF